MLITITTTLWTFPFFSFFIFRSSFVHECITIHLFITVINNLNNFLVCWKLLIRCKHSDHLSLGKFFFAEELIKIPFLSLCTENCYNRNSKWKKIIQRIIFYSQELTITNIHNEMNSSPAHCMETAMKFFRFFLGRNKQKRIQKNMFNGEKIFNYEMHVFHCHIIHSFVNQIHLWNEKIFTFVHFGMHDFIGSLNILCWIILKSDEFHFAHINVADKIWNLISQFKVN